MTKSLTFQQPGRLHTLNEISRVVSSTLDLSTLYETIYREIGRVMDASQFFIALHRPGSLYVEVPYLREEGNLQLNETFVYGGNMTSLVIDRGEPVLYNTDQQFHLLSKEFELVDSIVGTKDSDSGIFVPLNTGSRTIGALTVQSDRPSAYTPDDVQMLSVIASQAAVAIENARLYDHSQQSVRQMQALLHVAQMLNGSLDRQTVLDAILAGMRDVVPYHFASIMLPDHSKREMVIVGEVGPGHGGIGEHLAKEEIVVPFGSGITGTVYETGEALLVPDVKQHEGYISHGCDEVTSELAVPLKRGDTVIGVLDVERTEINGFSEDDLNWLSLFASQGAIAIENARLFEEQQDRVSELQTIQSIVQQLTPLHEIPDIAGVIDQELQHLIDYHACRIFLLDPEDQMLVYVNPSGPTGHIRVPIGEGFTGWIAQHAQSLIVPNTLEDPRGTHMAGTPYRVESIIGAPLAYEGKVQGVITLAKLGSDQFDENSVRLLQIIAAQAAIVFDRARLYEELHTQAVTDELTELFNRRYLLDRFSEEKSRAIRNGHSLAAIMVDIDNFKRINDQFGHDAGDIVLRDLARVIRAVARTEDVVVRYGGEEFCLLLPEVETADAELVGERLRELIERTRLHKEAGVRSVTVSVGVAVLTPDENFDDLFTLADEAMYEAKRISGNLVKTATARRQSEVAVP